jgi:hypothetical protein
MGTRARTAMMGTRIVANLVPLIPESDGAGALDADGLAVIGATTTAVGVAFVVDEDGLGARGIGPVGMADADGASTKTVMVCPFAVERSIISPVAEGLGARGIDGPAKSVWSGLVICGAMVAMGRLVPEAVWASMTGRWGALPAVDRSTRSQPLSLSS